MTYSFKYVDYTQIYGRIMQFGKNKNIPLHRWYPFVEGYSKEFIVSIIDEIGSKDMCVFDPFSGSGTTIVELQELGIECIAFEVNPFMFDLSFSKLEIINYSVEDINDFVKDVKKNFYRVEKDYLESVRESTLFSTLVEGEGKKKWNLDLSVFYGIERIKFIIDRDLKEKNNKLYNIALARVLLDLGNLYRNGKCMSYKKNKKEDIKEIDVLNSFVSFLAEFIEDISIFQNRNAPKISRGNSQNLYLTDTRQGIKSLLMDNSIDLVITSPPYLNSRDYTDSYMLELKALGYVENYSDIETLRSKTLRSHVQVKNYVSQKDISSILSRTVDQIIRKKDSYKSWNDNIVSMIIAYFEDIDLLFSGLHSKMTNNSKIYFNVSNSAYYGVLINTLEICAEIAERNNFNVVEIRKARFLNPSPQQRKEISKLLEGVIVLEKK